MSVAAVTLAPACAVWTVASVVGAVLYVSDPEAMPSYHGMASSITFTAPLFTAMAVVRRPLTACVGLVVYTSARLAFISLRFWEVHRFYSWPLAARTSFVSKADKHILNHADPHAMLAVTCGVVGLATEHAAQARAAAAPAASGIGPRGALATACVLSLVTQIVLRQGQTPDSGTVGTVFAMLIAAVGVIHAGTLCIARRRMHVTETLLLGTPALVSACVHRFIGKAADGKPVPAFDDLLASHFHLTTAVVCSYFVALDTRRPRGRGCTPLCIAYALTTALLLAVVCTLRTVTPATFHAVVGTLFASCGGALSCLALSSLVRPGETTPDCSTP